MRWFLFVLSFVLSLLVLPVKANECQMGFRYGILISPEQIRVLTADRTQFQINHDSQLFIQGEWITLSSDDTELLALYSQGMRKFVPQLVAIAVDSVELGLATIESMLTGIGNQTQQDEWKALVRETTYQLMSRFVRSGEHFYLAPQSLREMDAFLHGELKHNLDGLAKNSVGAVWGALQDTLRQTDDNFERSDPEGWQTMEQLVQKINAGLDAKAEELDMKSALFCERLLELDRIESQLHQQVPQLRRYDVVTSK